MAETRAYVVDASVAAKWYLRDEPFTREALAVYKQFIDGEVALLAPEQIHYEVPNAITVATWTSPPRLTYEEGRTAIDEFLSLGLTTFTDSELIAAAYPLTWRYRCAYYDAIYVALAERTGYPLVTADARLYRRIMALPLALWLGDLAIA